MADTAQRERGRQIKHGLLQAGYGAWLQGAGGEKYKSWKSFAEYYGITDIPPAAPKDELNRIKNKITAFVAYEDAKRKTV